MITLQQIIEEARSIVPNEYTDAEQVSWLNNINQDFFNVVKIPKIIKFITTTSATYTLDSDVREKNIDIVIAGVLKYRSLDSGNVSPLQNAYSFDDETHTLTLNPAPYLSGLQATVRTRRIATTTFLSSNLNAVPDAPEEYQWTYVMALCYYIADAMDDVEKASNYEARYKSAWNVAAQNYAMGVNA